LAFDLDAFAKHYADHRKMFDGLREVGLVIDNRGAQMLNCRVSLDLQLRVLFKSLMESGVNVSERINQSGTCFGISNECTFDCVDLELPLALPEHPASLTNFQRGD
jgi:hypothetical protein